MREAHFKVGMGGKSLRSQKLLPTEAGEVSTTLPQISFTSTCLFANRCVITTVNKFTDLPRADTAVETFPVFQTKLCLQGSPQSHNDVKLEHVKKAIFCFLRWVGCLGTLQFQAGSGNQWEFSTWLSQALSKIPVEAQPQNTNLWEWKLSQSNTFISVITGSSSKPITIRMQRCKWRWPGHPGTSFRGCFACCSLHSHCTRVSHSRKCSGSFGFVAGLLLDTLENTSWRWHI